MKAIKFLFPIMISISIILIGCTKEESDPENELSKGEINANRIENILKLNKNTIEWVKIYEYNNLTGKWDLAADNQSYYGAMDLCHIEDTYFYLNGTGSKTYGQIAPTHQLSGFYYFNLEYLVSFDLGPNKDELHLYFKY